MPTAGPRHTPACAGTNSGVGGWLAGRRWARALEVSGRGFAVALPRGTLLGSWDAGVRPSAQSPRLLRGAVNPQLVG